MRAVVDHHVDRPGVEARQRVQPTGTNRSIGLPSHSRTQEQDPRSPASRPGIRRQRTGIRRGSRAGRGPLDPSDPCLLNSELCLPATWWSWRGAHTRSHPELGRENPQRRWYCVLRRGRVGRRQVSGGQKTEDRRQSKAHGPGNPLHQTKRQAREGKRKPHAPTPHPIPVF